MSSRDKASKVPLIISNPHAGRFFPNMVSWKGSLTEDALHEMDRRGDTYTDWLAAPAVLQNAFQLVCRVAPAYLNVGRSKDSISPGHVPGWTGELDADPEDQYAKNGQGLVSTASYHTHKAFYKADRNPGEAEIIHRIDNYHAPYHKKLRDIARETQRTHGAALILDVHSCASQSENDGEITADIILSDAEGQSCSEHIMQGARSIAEDFGLEVAVNHPFKGGYVTQYYGAHGKTGKSMGTQALQIEFNRARYGMDEQTLSITDPEAFEEMQAFMAALSKGLINDIKPA